MSMIDNYWYVASFSVFTWSNIGLWLLIWCGIDLIFKQKIDITDVIFNFVGILFLSLIFNFWSTHNYNETLSFCNEHATQNYYMTNGTCHANLNGKVVSVNPDNEKD